MARTTFRYCFATGFATAAALFPDQLPPPVLTCAPVPTAGISPRAAAPISRVMSRLARPSRRRMSLRPWRGAVLHGRRGAAFHSRRDPC